LRGQTVTVFFVNNYLVKKDLKDVLKIIFYAYILYLDFWVLAIFSNIQKHRSTEKIDTDKYYNCNFHKTMNKNYNLVF